MSLTAPVVNLCRIAPCGYEHHRAFDEIAETLEIAIGGLGHQVAVCWNRLPESGLNVVIGAHLLDAGAADALGPETVVYNFEQIQADSDSTTPAWLRALRRATVWDYSLRNIERIRSLTGNACLVHVPVGYVRELTRIDPAPDQDIDVLFYGSINERRNQVLDRIQARGLTLHRAFGVYGAARDRLIARAKIVLNLHFYESQVFEIVRVSYLLANRKAVVCECDAKTELPADLVDAMRLAVWDDLPQTCEELVADVEARRHFEQAGFSRMAVRRACDFLREPLVTAFAVRQARG